MINVVFNRKGGVGKSSIVCNLAAVAASAGRSTLVIDLDPQANATAYLGHRAQDDVVSIANFFESIMRNQYRDLSPGDFVRGTGFSKLSLVSSSPELAELEQPLASRHKIYKFRDFVQVLSECFDEIWIDTPPVLNFYSLSALIAAKECFIPVDCDQFATNAFIDVLSLLREVQEDHNPSLALAGVIVNQFVPRAKSAHAIVAALKAQNVPILEPYLSTSVKMKESHSVCKPLIYLDARHKLSQQFVELYQTIACAELV